MRWAGGARFGDKGREGGGRFNGDGDGGEGCAGGVREREREKKSEEESASFVPWRDASLVQFRPSA